MHKSIFTIIFLFLVLVSGAFAQLPLGDYEDINYENPQEYEIGGITIKGVEHLDKNVLILLSGLVVGEKISIPGEKTAIAIETLWEQGLFSDVKISATNIQNNIIFLEIELEERPRLSKFSFKGVRKTEADNLREKIKLIKGNVVTPNLLATTKNTVKEYFVEKGFYNVEVNIQEVTDTTLKNNVILIIDVEKNNKVKIGEIIIHGNEAFTDNKIRRNLKDTKQKRWYNILKTSKFLEENLEKDLLKVIAKYNAKGYRDAQFTKDTVYRVSDKLLNIELTISEGNQYYFRNIVWMGNTKYSNKALDAILGIKKGDIFDQSVLESRLYMNPNGRDITSLYMDDGYLFFSVTPVEVMVEGDSIDIEMRIYEGKQATINKVTVVGNTKTNDHVIMREIRTKPGQLFSRADVIRSQRELSQLGYFNPESLGVNPTPNPAEGTVDIEYVVEEKPSDQIELSGGWGAGRVVGTLGVSFNNFSARNIFNKNAWRPLPSGDGQKLSLRGQTNGLWFQSYNASFTEPWLGGRKPNALSVSAYHSIQSNGQTRFIKTDGEKIPNVLRQGITISGVSVGLGSRLQWPDDFFTLYRELTYQHYTMNNWQQFIFSNGTSNNLSFKVVLQRNSIDQPIYPRRGSQTSFSLQLTPPYSLFARDSAGGPIDYSTLSAEERYKWAEYHKWKFTTSWFTELAPKLVLNTKAGFGFLGHYNDQIGSAPFERFYLGGSGLTGFALDGREIIALRGYEEQDLSPRTGGTIISKYTMELRYPISLNPSATVYALGFAEAGNTWTTFKKFDPFDVKRSAGVGVRIFLPMFGLFGLDYGWGFDQAPNSGLNPVTGKPQGQFHFTIGMNLGEL
ncbi:MAG: BamA/TamA family outer membrane protein [Bacteroidetes bacterium]|nr:BamA/TamA family outer membrane protein [Bacteroidota bacterium]HET6245513.1 POTRA domain-containing protein [Bacteroidia bacterium]